MCGLSGSVDTGLEARRRSVGALKAGRMQRVERANVLESIVVWYRQIEIAVGEEASFNGWFCAIQSS
jgi:hypothetical protein